MKRTLLLLTLAVSLSACKGNSDEVLEEDSATPSDEDCDPNNPGAGLAQEEIPYNGVDDDCDPLTLDDDLDEDGFEIDEDCDDENADIYPGAYENCDGVDENCDGQGDAGSPDALTLFADADADGYGDIFTTDLGCEPTKEWVSDNTDCDDTRADVNPGVEEVCGNRTDDNCDASAVPCEKLGEFSLDDCAVKILGADAGHLAGWGFNAVGDVNGDGLADLAIAATHGMETSDGLGEVYLVDGQVDGYYDLSDPSGLGYTLGVYQTDVAWEEFGTSLDIGDVTGDGVRDLVVSAPLRMDTTYQACYPGAVIVWEGPLTGGSGPIMPDSAVATVSGLEFFTAANGSLYCENDVLGFRVSVGDVTGDGVGDLLAGSYWDSELGSSGSAYVFAGGSSLSGEISATDADVTVSPSVEEAEFWTQQSIAWADLDGDGNQDLILGNLGDDGSTVLDSDGNEVSVQDAGAVYVFYGPLASGELDPATDADAVIRDVTERAYFGNVFGHHATDDFDGDGYTDLLVGAYGNTHVGETAGAIYLFSGPLVGEVSVEDATAVFYGEETGDEAADMGTAGDFNGDGVPDLVFGSDGADYGGERSGAAYVFYGPVSGEYGLGEADLILHGESAGEEVGFWTTGFGDGDGDGFDDIAITAPYDDENGDDAGAVYVCRGTGW